MERKVIDLEINTVKVTFSDYSQKTYRVDNLSTKNVGDLLQVVMDDEKNHLKGETDLMVYQWIPSPKKVIKLKDLTALDATFPFRMLVMLWEQSPNVQYQIVIKKVSDNLMSNKVKIQPSKKKGILAKEVIRDISNYIDPKTYLYCWREATSQPLQRPLSQFILFEVKTKGENAISSEYIQRIQRHQKVLICWANKYLKQRKMHISNLHRDTKDGVKLINLLEILSNKSVKEYYIYPETVQQKLQNCNIVIQFLKKFDIHIQARPKDFYHGNITVLYGTLYHLVKQAMEKAAKIRAITKRRRMVSVMLLNQRFSVYPSPSAMDHHAITEASLGLDTLSEEESTTSTFNVEHQKRPLPKTKPKWPPAPERRPRTEDEERSYSRSTLDDAGSTNEDDSILDKKITLKTQVPKSWPPPATMRAKNSLGGYQGSGSSEHSSLPTNPSSIPEKPLPNSDKNHSNIPIHPSLLTHPSSESSDSVSDSGIYWEYYDTNGSWSRYDEIAQQEIEKAYQGGLSEVTLTHGFFSTDPYTLFIKSILIQRNNRTGNWRPIRRYVESNKNESRPQQQQQQKLTTRKASATPLKPDEPPPIPGALKKTPTPTLPDAIKSQRSGSESQSDRPSPPPSNLKPKINRPTPSISRPDMPVGAFNYLNEPLPTMPFNNRQLNDTGSMSLPKPPPPTREAPLPPGYSGASPRDRVVSISKLNIDGKSKPLPSAPLLNPKHKISSSKPLPLPPKRQTLSQMDNTLEIDDFDNSFGGLDLFDKPEILAAMDDLFLEEVKINPSTTKDAVMKLIVNDVKQLQQETIDGLNEQQNKKASLRTLNVKEDDNFFRKSEEKSNNGDFKTSEELINVDDTMNDLKNFLDDFVEMHKDPKGKKPVPATATGDSELEIADLPDFQEEDDIAISIAALTMDVEYGEDDDEDFDWDDF